MAMSEDLQTFARQHKGLLIGGAIGAGILIFIKVQGGNKSKGTTADLNTIHQDLQQIDSDLLSAQQVGYTSLTGAIPGFSGTPTPNPPMAVKDNDQALINLINSKHILTSESQEASDLNSIMSKLGIKSTSGKGSGHFDFAPDFMPELSNQLSDFFHDRNAYIDQIAYGMPGDFNEDAGY